MKPKSEDNIAGQRRARDPFSAAKDDLLLTIGGHPCADENALKVSIWMVKEHANRREFEATGTVTAWPSIRLLASETGLTKSRVQRGIERLELMGVMRVERPEKRGAKHHNVYSLSAMWLRDRHDIERDIGTMKEETQVKKKSKNVRANVDIHFDGNVRNDTDIENGLSVRTGDAEMSSQADPNLLEDHLEGDGAPLGAPQSPVQELRPHDKNLTAERCGTVADDRDQPPLPSDGPQEGDEPIFDYDDRDLPEIPADVADRFRQEDEAWPPPETEADPEDLDDDLWLTDDLMTEPSEDGAFTAAIRDLRALHGADILDLEAFALDFTDGFLWSDFKARERAARCITKVLLQAGADAQAIWADHVKILKRLAIGNGQSHDAALATMANYHSAVAAAADAIKSERRRRMFDHSEEGATNHV